MKVPFLDLKSHHDPIKQEVMAAIEEVIDKNAFAGGPYVEKFEGEFAAYCQTDHGIGVGSGTEALWLALLALGVGPGDEVITVPVTFIATAEAISFTGAKPVFVDIEDQTYNMDPEKLESAITSKTKAIIPVHLFGQTADMDPILGIANKHGIPVIEDAAQAHGAEYNGKRAGSMGRLGCFSFYPGKNLGAFGEAGAVVTNDDELKKKIQILRDHGQAKKYYHDVVGWNGRMDGIQGAILSIKLKRLDQATESRRKNANRYNELLQGLESIVLPKEADGRKHVYHIYPIRTFNRDALIEDTKTKGIACGIHYPVPLHLQKAYNKTGVSENSFPISEKCSAEFVSLPMFPELTENQIITVSTELKSQYAE